MSKPGGSEASWDDERSPAEEVSEEAAVVRALYWALEEGNDLAVARYADPLIEWVDPMVARLPFDGTRRGLEAVLRGAFRRGEDGSGPRVRAGTFLRFGDGVLVCGRLLPPGDDRRGARAGPAGEPFLQECFVRAGKVHRIRGYPA